jgi:putative sigma-54 modulation protein
MQISAIQFKATDSLRDFADQEVRRLQKFRDDILSCNIEYSFNKQEKRAHIHVQVGSNLLNASEVTDDFKKSTVLAVDKLEAQIRKLKDKIQSKH